MIKTILMYEEKILVSYALPVVIKVWATINVINYTFIYVLWYSENSLSFRSVSEVLECVF